MRWRALGSVVPRLRSACGLPALLAAGCSGRAPDVIFLPSAADVADRMLELAGVTVDDVVYDLGCGDGRIVIRAAKRFGAQGVCVELDPGLVARSRAAADTAGVRDRIRFVRGDLFAVPLEGGTVVTLYLSPALNARLRPKLLRELRPGARVVSHNFGMGDWEADSVVTVTGPRGARSAVRLWTIPADVAGNWTLQVEGDARPRYQLRLEQVYQRVTGTASQGGRAVPLGPIRLDGRRIGLTLGDGSGAGLDGEIEGATMRGQGWQAWRR